MPPRRRRVNGRQKGAAGERRAAELLQPLFPDVRRRAAGEESQERRGVDLKNTPGFAVQVNTSAHPKPIKKFDEVARAAREGERPLSIYRQQSRSVSGEWLATIRVTDLVELLCERRRALAEFQALKLKLALPAAEPGGSA